MVGVSGGDSRDIPLSSVGTGREREPLAVYIPSRQVRGREYEATDWTGVVEPSLG